MGRRRASASAAEGGRGAIIGEMQTTPPRLRAPKRILALVLSALLLGACSQTSAPDIYGLWRTQTDDGRVVLLELRSDGTYTRTATFEGITFASKGLWTIEEGRKLRFEEQVETVDRHTTEARAVVEVPFELQSGMLVLKPGTPFEERYVLVQ